MSSAGSPGPISDQYRRLVVDDEDERPAPRSHSTDHSRRKLLRSAVELQGDRCVVVAVVVGDPDDGPIGKVGSQYVDVESPRCPRCLNAEAIEIRKHCLEVGDGRASGVRPRLWQTNARVLEVTGRVRVGLDLNQWDHRVGHSQGLRSDLDEARCVEVTVEGECFPDASPAHHGEAGGIDE